MDATLELHVAPMDAKHEEFLLLLQKMQSSSKEDFLPLFKQMITHTQEHFAFEESIMNEYNFYDKHEHFSEHKNLLDEMHYFYEKGKKSPPFAKSYNNEYSYEKFKRHVINIDSQLAMFIKERNITLEKPLS